MRLAFYVYMLASSFLPINCILLAKFYLAGVHSISWVLLFAINIGIYGTIRILNFADSKAPAQVFELKSFEAVDENALAYIVTYVPIFMSLSENELSSIIAITVFYVFISVLFVNSKFMFVNPIFMLFGWRFYEVTFLSEGATFEGIVLSKKPMKTNSNNLELRRLTNLGTYVRRA